MNKRKIRFNAIDVLLILVLLAIVAAVLYIFVLSDRGGDTLTAATHPIEYVIEVSEVEEQYVSLIKEGQPVEDAVWRKQIGTVAGVEAAPYEKVLFDYKNNEETTASRDGYVTLKITVAADAEETDRAFLVNGDAIRVGLKYSVRLPDFYGEGFCTKLTKVQ